MQEKTDNSDAIISTRHKRLSPEEFDNSKPRLGRRESEPHSDEINYLYDVLTTNFPDDRAMWDLHHYFTVDDLKIDLQFDVSYFKDMHIPERLSSYKAEKYNGRVPNMAINVLSKSTWKTDIGENLDYCRRLQIPLYIVFPTYHIATKLYEPPFVRAYILQPDGEYHIEELRQITIDGEKRKSEAVIDISQIVPFRLGLQKRNVSHESNKPLFRVILLHPDKFQVYLTKTEKAQEQAEKAQEQAEKALHEKNEAKKKAQLLEKKIKKLKEKFKKK
jgi:Uma2 family endonuclease